MALSNNQLYLILGITILIVITLVFMYKKLSSNSDVTKTTVSSDNKEYLPVFSEGEGKKTANVSPNFKYNPSTNVLTASTFKGNLDGAAKNVNITSDINNSLMPQRIVNTGGYQTMSNIDSVIKQGHVVKAQGLVGQSLPTETQNKRYLTMTATNTNGPQSLIISPTMWYDSTNNFLNVDVSGAYNIRNGNSNQILFQRGPNDTGFINAPTNASSNQYLKWNGNSYEFSPFPEGTSIKASGLQGQIQFNDGGNLGASPNLSFSNNILKISGSGSTVDAASFLGNALSANTATNLAGAGGNRIPVQIGNNTTSFITPTGTNSFLRWNGSTYEFTNALAAGTSANQVQFRDATGNLSASSNLSFNPTNNNLLITGGSLNASTGAFSGGLSAGTGSFSALLSANGGLNASTGAFSGGLSAGTGNFSGLLSANGGLNASTGAFTGALTAGTGSFSGITVGSNGIVTAGIFQGNLIGNANSATKVMITSI